VIAGCNFDCFGEADHLCDVSHGVMCSQEDEAC
jgi:hypothetical protein